MEDFQEWHEPQFDPAQGISIRKSRQQRDEWLEEERKIQEEEEESFIFSLLKTEYQNA